MKILILDDSKERWYGFRKELEAETLCFVPNADLAIEALSEKSWDVLFLDHDLGQNRATGYDVACWLEENPRYTPEIVVVHSMNPVGSKRIALALISNAYVYYVPGAWSNGTLSAQLDAFSNRV